MKSSEGRVGLKNGINLVYDGGDYWKTNERTITKFNVYW